MVRIPEYARQNISTFVAPAQEPSVVGQVASVAQTLSAASQVAQKIQSVSDEANAARVASEADIQAQTILPDLLKKHEGNPDAIRTEVPKAISEVYKDFSGQLNTTNAKNDFMSRGYRNITQWTLGALKTNASDNKKRIQSDVAKSDINTQKRLSYSPNLTSLVENANLYLSENENLHGTTYGAQAAAKREKWLSDTVQMYAQGKALDNPEQLLKEVDSLKGHINAEELADIKTMAEKGMERRKKEQDFRTALEGVKVGDQLAIDVAQGRERGVELANRLMVSKATGNDQAVKYTESLIKVANMSFDPADPGDVAYQSEWIDRWTTEFFDVEKKRPEKSFAKLKPFDKVQKYLEFEQETLDAVISGKLPPKQYEKFMNSIMPEVLQDIEGVEVKGKFVRDGLRISHQEHPWSHVVKTINYEIEKLFGATATEESRKAKLDMYNDYYDIVKDIEAKSGGAIIDGKSRDILKRVRLNAWERKLPGSTDNIPKEGRAFKDRNGRVVLLMEDGSTRRLN